MLRPLLATIAILLLSATPGALAQPDDGPDRAERVADRAEGRGEVSDRSAGERERGERREERGEDRADADQSERAPRTHERVDVDRARSDRAALLPAAASALEAATLSDPQRRALRYVVVDDVLWEWDASEHCWFERDGDPRSPPQDAVRLARLPDEAVCGWD